MIVRVAQYLVAVLLGVLVALALTEPGSFLLMNLTAGAVPAGGAFLVGVDTVQKQRQKREAENQALLAVRQLRTQRDLERKKRELGLPVVITPSVTANGPVPWPDVPGWHICRGKAYPAAAYCPVHGTATSVTPVKGADVPPLEQLAKVSVQYHLPLAGVSMVQFTAHVKAMQEALTFPDGGPFLAEDEPEGEPEAEEEEAYVPDGQAELDALLLAHMRQQVKDAAPSRAGHDIPYPGNWTMNSEWHAEVRKLKKANGQLLWPPGRYTVLGYCVKLGSEYGAPSLETP